MTDLHDASAVAAVAARIEAWLERERTENPIVAAVDRAGADSPEPRWYVRLRGEDKEFTTVWLTLGQRTLRYETYVLPAPEENQAEFYEHLLRRNDRLVGAHFSIGLEDAVFLRGELPLALVVDDELDRIIGSLWTYVEQCFRPALQIGFASRLAARAADA